MEPVALHLLPLPAIELDYKGVILDVSPLARKVFGKKVTAGTSFSEHFNFLEEGFPANGARVWFGKTKKAYRLHGTLPAEGSSMILLSRCDDGEGTKQALDEQVRRFESLLKSLDGIVFELDEDSRCLNVWARDESLLFVPKKEIIGKHIRELMPPGSADFYVTILEEVIARRETRDFEYPGLNGLEEKWFHAEMSPMEVPDGEKARVSLFIREITEERRHRLQTQNNLILLEAIREAQDEYFLYDRLGPAFDRMLNRLLEVTGSTFGFIGEVLRHGQQPYLKTYAISNIAWDEDSRKFYENKAPVGMEFHNLNTLFGYTLTTGKALVTNDPNSDPRSGGTPLGHPRLESYCGIPLFSHSEMVGMIGIANRPGGYTEGLVADLQPSLYAYGLLIRTVRTNEEYRLSLQAISQARTQALEASREKAEFLSVMSHEIRTPLNAVIGLTELLKMSDPREDQLDYLNSLHFSAENLLNLVSDILDFSKIEAGKLELENIEFSLRDLLTQLSLAYGHRAKEKGLNWSLNMSDDLPPLVIGDPVRLGQALTNLLSNAVKFTESGEVLLQAETVEEGQNRTSVRFSVKDNGPGVPKGKQKKIFEAFTQADSSTSRTYGGTGLGLTITRRLLEMMKSRIELRSEPGLGSDFSFTISFSKPQVPGRAESKKGVAPLNLAGLRFLVVDDNPINLTVTGEFLKKWGAAVQTATSGELALEILDRERFDLVFMDLRMPGMDGLETTRRLKKKFPKLPVVALTASAAMERKNEVLEAGMEDFITKPFNSLILAQKLETLLGLKS